ncbi:hypothetical protein NQ176_g4908 [Zarea fungicola]|uniref:Uncharacterized protein n=1 Tax=Zarea fungicola TaxID=93591 RepID=A0ACC1NB43_9HYPO|nr:hypothetical protein NQ176_g4908 [Lecanicillium fungicola]
MGNSPSIPTDPRQQVQVIGAGFSRTGTGSFTMAMEKLLGGPAFHGGSQCIGREDAFAKLYHDVFKYRHDKPRLKKLLRELTSGFVAVADSPIIFFAEELCELYPDALVICMTRDKESWWRSMKPLQDASGAWWMSILLWPCPGWRWLAPTAVWYNECCVERYGVGLSPDTYDKHIEYVKRVVPKERLHFVSLHDGWRPICEALDKPIPEEPFPRTNESGAVSKVVSNLLLKALLIWIMLLSTLGTMIYLALLFLN